MKKEGIQTRKRKPKAATQPQETPTNQLSKPVKPDQTLFALWQRVSTVCVSASVCVVAPRLSHCRLCCLRNGSRDYLTPPTIYCRQKQNDHDRIDNGNALRHAGDQRDDDSGPQRSGIGPDLAVAQHIVTYNALERRSNPSCAWTDATWPNVSVSNLLKWDRAFFLYQYMYVVNYYRWQERRSEEQEAKSTTHHTSKTSRHRFYHTQQEQLFCSGGIMHPDERREMPFRQVFLVAAVLTSAPHFFFSTSSSRYISYREH